MAGYREIGAKIFGQGCGIIFRFDDSDDEGNLDAKLGYINFEIRLIPFFNSAIAPDGDGLIAIIGRRLGCFQKLAVGCKHPKDITTQKVTRVTSIDTRSNLPDWRLRLLAEIGVRKCNGKCWRRDWRWCGRLGGCRARSGHHALRGRWNGRCYRGCRWFRCGRLFRRGAWSWCEGRAWRPSGCSGWIVERDETAGITSKYDEHRRKQQDKKKFSTQVTYSLRGHRMLLYSVDRGIAN